MNKNLSVTDPSANISDSAPKATSADVAHTIVKSAVASVPLVGGAAAEAFSLIINEPLSKRRDEWIESVVAALKNLEKQVDGFSVENLKDDESFITAVVHASQIAIRTHQREKLNALKNALLNSALPNSPDDDLKLIFLDYVNSATEWHLRILNFLDDPSRYYEANEIAVPNMSAGTISTVMVAALNDLRDRRGFYDLIVKDLHAKGLLGIDSLHTMMTGNGIMQSRTTDFGRQFLGFISAPNL